MIADEWTEVANFRIFLFSQTKEKQNSASQHQVGATNKTQPEKLAHVYAYVLFHESVRFA